MTEIIYGPTCMDCNKSMVDTEQYYKPFDEKYICFECLHDGTNDLIYNFLKEKGEC